MKYKFSITKKKAAIIGVASLGLIAAIGVVSFVPTGAPNNSAKANQIEGTNVPSDHSAQNVNPSSVDVTDTVTSTPKPTPTANNSGGTEGSTPPAAEGASPAPAPYVVSTTNDQMYCSDDGYWHYPSTLHWNDDTTSHQDIRSGSACGGSGSSGKPLN